MLCYAWQLDFLLFNELGLSRGIEGQFEFAVICTYSELAIDPIYQTWCLELSEALNYHSHCFCYDALYYLCSNI